MGNPDHRSVVIARRSIRHGSRFHDNAVSGVGLSSFARCWMDMDRDIRELVRRRLVEEYRIGGDRTLDVEVAADLRLPIADVRAVFNAFERGRYLWVNRLATGHLDILPDTVSDRFRDLSRPLS